jgi:hypothetical protein
MTQSTVAPLERIVTVGVDTHDDIHVAVALDQLGRNLGTTKIPTTPAGLPAARVMGTAVRPDLRLRHRGHGQLGRRLGAPATRALPPPGRGQPARPRRPPPAGQERPARCRGRRPRRARRHPRLADQRRPGGCGLEAEVQLALPRVVQQLSRPLDEQPELGLGMRRTDMGDDPATAP